MKRKLDCDCDHDHDHDRITHRARYAVIAALAFAMTALSGCMLMPSDGTVIASTGTAITFAGYTTLAAEPVQVEAFDGFSWGAIANATSDTTPFTYDGTDLFGWTASAAVPASRWRPGITGFAAQVRARVGATLDNQAITFTPSWSSCLASNPDLLDFINRCKTPRSPSAFLYTPDYPGVVDLTITNIQRNGGLDVTVRNGGRPGRILRLECFRPGAAIALEVNAAINPVETQVLHTSLSALSGQTVTCTVLGVNENGAAELNTANNTRSQVVF